ncbi:MAG: shikimate dehydrogenase [Litoreibacter sp.]|nr:shikimate dehydrogenase [Litoreibacter sp.]
MNDNTPQQLKLGLIGDKIASSRAPALHRAAGTIAGYQVTYDLLIPQERGLPFEALFEWARDAAYHGLNITYPYKERVVEYVTIDGVELRALGAVNTVLFQPDGARGFNTDHDGFLYAFREALGDMHPGVICLIGCGGVGRAIGFALAGLGAAEIRCVDLDLSRAERLSDDLSRAFPLLRACPSRDAVTSAQGAQGVLNCTAVGMEGKGGPVLTSTQLDGADWAFDAVYTPMKTGFLREAAAAGVQIISGYKLFFWQGVYAWKLFSGTDIDPAALRRALV